ncbi:TonB-dependent receptor [Komagataeibacter xylinus]|nr:TonB-dependent receptor [Komagataeibacter xylinus]
MHGHFSSRWTIMSLASITACLIWQGVAHAEDGVPSTAHGAGAKSAKASGQRARTATGQSARNTLNASSSLASGRQGPGARGHANGVEADGAGEAIIVTGTHASNRRAYDSVSPISVISAAALQRTGQVNLADSLVRMDPSITAQQVGKGGASLVSSIRMRGLSPNEVLVLVDGKRRHNSATISISSGTERGSSGVDLNMIPASAIDHIEILRDGAAAMYGSDAIAGVVNIVLKKRVTGFQGSVQTGANAYNGDGWQTQVNLGGGIAFGNSGYFRIDGQYMHTDHMEPRTYDVGSTKYNFPSDINHINSTPEETRGNIGISFGGDLATNVHGYGSVTYAHRHDEQFQNYRYPNSLPTLYPNGYSPIETNDENDFNASLGIKVDDLLGFNWDFSTTYGEDISQIDTINTANIDLYELTGSTPTHMNDTKYSFSQWTNNIDLRRNFKIGNVVPMTLAMGAEQRLDMYQLWAGEPASYVDGGAQGYSGLMPSNAGKWDRDIWAAYIDGDFHLTPKWELDFAGRFEHYTDGTGNNETGKVSTRYNFNKRIAIRGTISNGFEAPTLLQEHFSSTNVGPTSATGLLSPTSAGGEYLGGQHLKAERSTSVEGGVVLEPIDRFHISADVYQIDIRDRIYVGSSTYGEDAVKAIGLSGASLASTVLASNVSAITFANVGTTRTQGLDIRADYVWRSPRFGTFRPSLALSLNRTRLRHNNTDQNGNPYLNQQTTSFLTTASPRSKIILELNWNLGKWDATIRQTRYGQTTTMMTYEDQAVGTCNGQALAFSNSCWLQFHNTPAWLTDLEIGYRPTEMIHVAVGANDIFNVRPRKVPLSVNYRGASPYDLNSSGISYMGGYYYARVDVKM